ncbi:hypothetical protein [Rhodococcus sp. SBT000017]|uniref:hypothetical protein n=1 Tax=Rhodococcus sp. SBT000017 TaxID=1803385 RepID=UPI0011C4498A|nr:hypothetical protein [Rhodococcus sp. SBT000017]
MSHTPEWFTNGKVFVSYAPTVGINKDGDTLYDIDAETGTRTNKVNDLVRRDIAALLDGETTDTSRWVESQSIAEPYIGVPVYFDNRPDFDLENLLKCEDMQGFESISLGDLIDRGSVIARQGHGSPSADMRTGTVPYIKVSDLRAGQVNINPTNRVTEVVAKKYWRGGSSGLAPFDLLTPIRTSKNIGDFAVLMPGQEHLVLTKEILVLHASDSAEFDNFYLLWAMSLKAVRRQWDRIIFMQTNREDVGTRYREIRVPIAPDARTAYEYSAPMRAYYEGMHKLRDELLTYLTNDERHHIFMSSNESVIEEVLDLPELRLDDH